MLNLCITCDHELYFGENYVSEEDVFIKPSYALCKVLEKHNVRATFFADVCSVFRYRSLNMLDYPNQVERQLTEIVQRGHDVQLHVHPHWYHSEYRNGCWSFDRERYCIHSFGFEHTGAAGLTADRIVSDGKAYLETLLHPVRSSYQCIAFRAGGLCLQPERELLKVLKKQGIHIDSTVVKGGYAHTDVHTYDYLHTPAAVNWWINPETGLGTAAEADWTRNVFEVPIGSLTRKPRALLLYLRNKLAFVVHEPARGSYMPITTATHASASPLKRISRRIYTAKIILSFDAYCAKVLISVLRTYLSTYDCAQYDYFVSIICHPKILREAHFREIDAFLQQVINAFPQIRFTTLQQVYDHLRAGGVENARRQKPATPRPRC